MNARATIMPFTIITSPLTSIGTRLLPEWGAIADGAISPSLTFLLIMESFSFNPVACTALQVSNAFAGGRRSSGCSSFFAKQTLAPKPVPVPEQDAMSTGDAELEALRDPPRALDEMRLGLGRTDLARGLLEQRQPAVEMVGVDG